MSITLPAGTSNYNGDPIFRLTRDTEQAYHQVVAMHFNACPVELEKVAEAHVMGLLPKEQAIAFEDHFAACDTCATVVYKIADYVGAMNAARRNVPWEPTN